MSWDGLEPGVTAGPRLIGRPQSTACAQELVASPPCGLLLRDCHSGVLLVDPAVEFRVPFQGLGGMPVANEMSALTEIAAEAIDRLAITPAEQLHMGIAKRVFDSIGVASIPTRLAHDRLATSAYAVTRIAMTRGAGALATALRNASRDADIRPLSRSADGRMVIGALNGMAGDRLAERGSDLAVRMAVRDHGVDVSCTRDAVAHAFPTATSQIAVFVHGLGGTEEWWQRRGRGNRTQPRRHFGAGLRDDAGCTPVYVRFNSGLHVSQNGAHLSALLEALIDAWPVQVQRLVLIGHSMGGLVIRSACHAGTHAERRWPALTTHVVTLGTPHHGAPLAKVVHRTAWALRALPETRPMAQILDTRSAGIRDLRFGALHEDDWRDESLDAFDDRRREIPLLPGCQYTFITATITVNPNHRVGLLLGDLLVRTESASGRCRERVIPVAPESVVHLGGLTHLNLLDHPQVYVVVRDAISLH
jgi:pimeloyl-ACP methyl ester carboxylesterase